MFKRFLLSILCLLSATTNMHSMEGSDLNIDGNATTLNIDHQSVNVNKYDYRTYKANHYPPKAYNDKDSTFAQKVAGTLINGSWEGLEALPGRIMFQITDLALQFTLKKFVDWFNNMPSDTPIVGLTRDMGVLEAQLELNAKDLKRLMTDKKRAEESHDEKDLQSIEEIVQELREIRKELNSQLRTLMLKNRAV
jgi:hypothetical protein